MPSEPASGLTAGGLASSAASRAAAHQRLKHHRRVRDGQVLKIDRASRRRVGVIPRLRVAVDVLGRDDERLGDLGERRVVRASSTCGMLRQSSIIEHASAAASADGPRSLTVAGAPTRASSAAPSFAARMRAFIAPIGHPHEPSGRVGPTTRAVGRAPAS